MPTAIWWIRRDLRLVDNPALAAALDGSREVVPAFVLEPGLLDGATTGPKPLAFLFEGLRQLDAALRTLGSYLIVREGDPRAVLSELMSESGATRICAERDDSPDARSRDAAVGAALPLELVDGLCIHPPGSVVKADGTPYIVFTPFSRAWRALPLPTGADLIPLPDIIPTPAGLPALPMPAKLVLPPDVPFAAGETAATRTLESFIGDVGDVDDQASIHDYHEQRDLPAVEGTSGLSPYLRFGMISARTAAVRALDPLVRGRGADTWLTELIWRDFFIHILHHFPQVAAESFRPELRDIAWANDPADFEAWCAGQTGYPIVDAGMRQLLATGWMHNRVRMIVASFLVKDLLVDWRWGERHFMRHLLDGDPAVNNGNWQWAAGTGTDAAPYFRIFNPIAQGERFDPAGAYVRRWVPELAAVPDRLIHRPWDMPHDVQRAAGCILGRDYPPPIVDHTWARERVLAAYRRGQAGR